MKVTNHTVIRCMLNRFEIRLMFIMSGKQYAADFLYTIVPDNRKVC